MASEGIELTWPGKELPRAAAAAVPAFAPTEVYGDGGARGGQLYVGDNLAVLEHVRRTLGPAIDLVYIDPPFCTGNAFALQTLLSDSGSVQEVRRTQAYADRWERGLAGYLAWLEPRLRAIHQVLAPTGSLVVHLDWRAASHVRIVLDEIFGPERLRNQLIWYKGFRGTQARKIFQHAHDILWWYTKGDDYYWRQTHEAYRDQDLRRYNKTDGDGRRYALIKRRREDGTIYYGKTYPGEQGKWRNDVIADVPTMAATAPERTGFATQKPVRLLEILIESLCPEGGLAADFFCGSGTTLRAAARLGRRFLGADQEPIARNMTRRGLLAAVPDANLTVCRDAAPAPESGVPWLARERDGRVVLEPDAAARLLVDFWAVGTRRDDGALRPAWVSTAAPAAGDLPTASPPVPPGERATVLAASRDGTEWWTEL
jgi:DNA modification methylase